MLLPGKLRKAVHWVSIWDKGGPFLPTTMDSKTGKFLGVVFFSNHPQIISPAVELFQHVYYIPTLFDLYIMSNIVKKLDNYMWSVVVTGGIDTSTCKSWTLLYGP